MPTRQAAIAIGIASLFTLLAPLAQAQSSSNSMEQGFANPPDSAKPRTWWHWTGGNVTKDGITKDLEWMKRVGIGGMQLADVSYGQGQSVEKKIVFGSPEWLDAVRHAAVEAKRLGLEMTIFSSAGWSETGGPWVKPEQAMKKLVWSEIAVDGPRQFTGKLPQPPSNNGPIRNLRAGGNRTNAPADPTYYGDSAVVAFHTPGTETDLADFKPDVAANGSPIDASALFDDDLNSSVTVSAPQDGSPACVQFTFVRPFTARAITIAGRGGIPVGRVLAGDDGTNFQTLVTLPGAQLYRQGQVRTFAFPQIAAKCFRIEMTGAPLGPAATMSQAPSTPAAQYILTEAKLHSGGRVHRAEEKAGFSFLFEYESVPTPEVPPTAAIYRPHVVDLTSRMAADGSIDWEIPPGKWTILRLGYSLTGAKNRPAPPSGSGYEADKLSRKHMESYFHGYFDPIAKTLGPLFGDSLQCVMMDSWEAGYQNWTDDMIAEFRKRRGYDPTPYLAVLTGRIVDSAEVSDRFLWDFRRTLADMFAEYHYGVMTELLHKHGLKTYAEAAGVSLEIPEDSLLNKSRVDIPMGEFWVRDLHPRLMYFQDVRGAASASHVYGKRLVAAESFTGGGYESPYKLKQVGDYWLAQGINRIVFHTSAHQPLDTKPGNVMVGTHINRNITWAEQAKPFMTCLARDCFMLQQGLFVADLAYLLNEGAPSTMPIWGNGLTPPPPEGYDYDYINADVLLNRMSVDETGKLTLPDGMSYRALVLPQVEPMRPELLRKIRELVAGGATVVGPKPTRSPSLAGYPGADTEVRALAGEIWGDLDGVSRTTRRYGKGTVVWGLPIEKVLSTLNLPKDFEYTRGLDAECAWLHRRAGDTDIYYVANLTDRAQDFEARFRVAGREAEFWHADTGAMEPAGYTFERSRTVVPLHLAEHESVFVVFPRPAASPSRTLSQTKNTTLSTLGGAWEVNFPADFSGPPRVTFPELQPWTLSTNDSVKSFSGTATYSKSLQAPASWFRPGTKLLLDLGAVRDLAEVSLNGKELGILWKPPYQVDATGALKPDENHLEIKVTNEWPNRPRGIAPGGAGASAPVLAESGLLGPVSIISKTQQ